MHMRHDFWPSLAFHAAAILVLSSCDGRIRETLRLASDPHPPIDLVDSPPVLGTLRISTFAATSLGENASPSILRTRFVNGADYSGMEDNDLRGFLDGAFKYAWNQPGQVHVRIGRRGIGPRFGEYEIFRVIHRWSELGLPPDAHVRRARLTLFVEESPAKPVRLVLYEIKKDWNPGIGGALRDNVSPPNPGEVWWGELAADSTKWGLPGVGYASDDDPNADTGAMPLADAIVAPGAKSWTYDTPALAAYATRRARDGAPLLFLLKVSDAQEDVAGSLLNVYSGSTGDSRNLARRPCLELEWDSQSETSTFERAIHLEHGRSLELPRVPTGGGMIAGTFSPDSGAAAPTLEVRAGTATETGSWRKLEGVVPLDGEWAQVRVLAAVDPVPLGTPFRATMHDTWIRTARPEDQKAPWTFVSPTGARYVQMAQYAGEFDWSMEFVPDEIGSWRYWWAQTFTEKPYASTEATFDVVLGEPAAAIEALRKIAKEGAAAHQEKRKADTARLMGQFARLERAAMLSLTPESFATADGESLKAALRAARVGLGNEKVPDSIPRVPDRPPEWKN